VNDAKSRTLPELLFAQAAARPQAIALRAKRRGIWRETTWAAYAGSVQAIAASLAAAGLTPGQVMLIQGSNTAARQQVEFAVLAAGAVALCADDAATAADLRTLCATRPPWGVVGGNDLEARQLQRIAAEAGACDPRCWTLWEEPGVATPSVDSLERDGRTLLAQQPNAPAPACPPQPGDPALMLLTCGTDGPPRVVELSHELLVGRATALAAAAALQQDDLLYSLLPAGWIGDRLLATAMHPAIGCVLAFPEETRTALTDLQECGPTVLLAPPRFWQLLLCQLRVRGSGRTLRARLVQRTLAGGKPSPWQRLLVAPALRDHAGLTKLRQGFCAGGALDAGATASFLTLGVPVRRLYLVTEAGGPVALAGADGDLRSLAGVECGAQNGELCLSVTGLATIPTGDAGAVDGEMATVVGRLSDRITLPYGQVVDVGAAARAIEASPYVRHALLDGAGPDGLVALLDIETSVVRAWCDAERLELSGHGELRRSSAVRGLLEKAVAVANRSLPAAAQIVAFALLEAPLERSTGELTRLLGVRRPVAIRAHADELQRLRGGAGEAAYRAPRTEGLLGAS